MTTAIIFIIIIIIVLLIVIVKVSCITVLLTIVKSVYFAHAEHIVAGWST
jgi:hypothetical protein